MSNPNEEVINSNSSEVDKNSSASISTMDGINMMTQIALDNQTVEDIRQLTSSKVTDQLKVFLIAQARNELSRVIKLTKFLDRIEDCFINAVERRIEDDTMSLRQYNDAITLITNLLTRSNEIISKILKDDSLTTVLSTTIYQEDQGPTSSSVVASLKDAQSRERVRNIIQNILLTTANYESKSSQKDNRKEIVEAEDVTD